MMSFIDGWLTLVGNWTVTLSINFGGAQLILSAITLWNEDYVPNEWQTILTFWALMLICALINVFGSRYLDLINKICIYWTSTSVIIIMATLLSMADNRRSAKFVFTHYDASASGWYVEIRMRFSCSLLIVILCTGLQDGRSLSACFSQLTP